MKITPLTRWLTTLGLLAGLLLLLDPRELASQINTLAPQWLLLALLISVCQTALSAWRWRFTAGLLGLELSPGRALAEYYLAAFVNQTLPGGVLGDAWRAQRHAKRSGQTGIAWRAVIVERASGQIVIAVLGVAVLFSFGTWPSSGWRSFFFSLAGFLIFGILLWMTWHQIRRPAAWLHALFFDARRALFSAEAWPAQLLSSLLIVLSYLLVFALGALGLGIQLPVWQLMMMALPVLLSMLIPLSVAGWGVREGAAGLVWLSVGLSAEQGVAASLAYGVLVLLASLPGALVLGLPGSAQAHIDQ